MEATLQPAENYQFSSDAWQRLRARGVLRPDVDSLAKYQERFYEGSIRAFQYLHSAPLTMLVRAEALRTVHGFLFSELLTCAGVYRTPQQQVTAGTPQPADPRRIAEELDLREVQTRELLLATAPPGGNGGAIVAAVFAHVRAKCIQPFIDGNKRSSRFISSEIIHKTLGAFPAWGSPEEYLAALQFAKKGDLTAMVNVVRASIGISPVKEPVRSQFRLRPFLIGDGVYREGMNLSELYELSMKVF